MRTGLSLDRVRSIYDRVAGHYDFQHKFLTAGSDQRGRKFIVRHAVSPGDRVLDAGAGTGSTSLLAAERVGSSGHVTLLDVSQGMLGVAKRRLREKGLDGRVDVRTGSMTSLPFAEGSFDVVLSSYSVCPLYDPAEGAKEMLRVLRPGGRLGIAHSIEPSRAWVRWLADRVEDVIWHLPLISLGCRSVSILPALREAGTKVLFEKRLGVPLWPFLAFVVEKLPSRGDGTQAVAEAP